MDNRKIFFFQESMASSVDLSQWAGPNVDPWQLLDSYCEQVVKRIVADVVEEFEDGFGTLVESMLLNECTTLS